MNFVISASATRIGGRSENQDNYGSTTTPFGQLLVVCDGMGGGPGGRTASTTAVDTFIQSVVDADISATSSDAMTHAAVKVNDVLQQMMQHTPELQGMGTTIVAILFTQNSAVIAHVGDSRLYQLHDGKVLFRTKDHSMVAEMVRNGTLTEEQARLSSQSNIITRALGAGFSHDADIDIVPFTKGDRFVLCTDGIWGSMSEKDLVSYFSQNKNISVLVEDIAAKVDKIGIDKGGHHDNLTLTIIDVIANSMLRPQSVSIMTRICNFFRNII